MKIKMFVSDLWPKNRFCFAKKKAARDTNLLPWTLLSVIFLFFQCTDTDSKLTSWIRDPVPDSSVSQYCEDPMYPNIFVRFKTGALFTSKNQAKPTSLFTVATREIWFVIKTIPTMKFYLPSSPKSPSLQHQPIIHLNFAFQTLLNTWLSL